jgi:hypothetical protein
VTAQAARAAAICKTHCVPQPPNALQTPPTPPLPRRPPRSADAPRRSRQRGGAGCLYSAPRAVNARDSTLLKQRRFGTIRNWRHQKPPAPWPCRCGAQHTVALLSNYDRLRGTGEPLSQASRARICTGLNSQNSRMWSGAHCSADAAAGCAISATAREADPCPRQRDDGARACSGRVAKRAKCQRMRI